MKVVAIERFPVAMNTANGMPCIQSVIIRIRTDSGIDGLGEAMPTSTSISSHVNQISGTLAGWLATYEAALVGSDVLNINAMRRLLDCVSTGFPPACQAARAAIDMAIHDIIGKAWGCPVHRLLGGTYRTEFEMLTHLSEGKTAQMVGAARRSIERRFRGLKVRISSSIGNSMAGHDSSISAVDAVQKKLLAVLKAVGPEIAVDVDANQAWGSPGIVRSLFEKLLSEHFYGNLSLEQPLHYLDLKGHAQLREKLAIPIILDESVVSPEAMAQIVRLEAADRVVIDLGRVGGLQSARRIADICEAAAIGVSLDRDVLPYSKLTDTAHCHVAATLRDPYPIGVCGHLLAEQTPFVGGIEIEKGRAVLGTGPGLGVELDEDLLRSMMLAE